MSYTTLISTAVLSNHLLDDNWVIVDCRFSLDDTERGRRDYNSSHIPGARYAHLDEDLSGPIIPGNTGRHPLPKIERFAQTLGEWGIGDGIQVAAYDDWGGALAARLWWMLHWLGHETAAVLDGGWPQWLEEKRPVQSTVTTPQVRHFTPRPRDDMLVDVAAVDAIRLEPEQRLFDARGADRYRGENETIDPVAGHIPGAASAPYEDNLTADGLFLPAETLRRRFESLLGDVPPEESVFYCGSGVSAAHNLLAMAHAGLNGGKLYVGSWSEWITDPQRPTAT